MPKPDHHAPVPLAKATRLLNHGPTVLVTAAHGGRANVMAAAWTLPLDFDPPKVLAVIAADTFTRALVDASGEFALNLPPVALARATLGVGSESGRDHADKFARHGLTTFTAERVSAPLVAGCVAWLECRVLRDERYTRNERDHDLFIAEVVAAAADTRVFSAGRWHFETAPAELRTLHHVAGGHFYAIGAPVEAS
jgi:flavin reductase (DIM6/NTAB) family NADH-FMN oxidoreductase RutF